VIDLGNALAVPVFHGLLTASPGRLDPAHRTGHGGRTLTRLRVSTFGVVAAVAYADQLTP
jgi:hypothetical protein